jgi:hypothetical protein
MISFQQVLRRILRRPHGPTSKEVSSDFAYKIYWTRRVQDWSAERRRSSQSAVQEMISRPDFVPNEFTRRYELPELDELAHSGSSLMALLSVLNYFDHRVDLEE